MCLDLPGKASAARDAREFKDFILPLSFLKRLSDVFQDEIQALEQDFGSQQKALKLADADHQHARISRSRRRQIPTNRWGQCPQLSARR